MAFYSHEMPTDKDNPLAKQNIKDRYHGTNDPVARKILSGYAATKGLVPPEDPSVVCLVLCVFLPSISGHRLTCFV